MMDGSISELARVIWDWLPLSDEQGTADMIFVFGSDAASVPRLALELYRHGVASEIIVSGGFGRLTGASQKPEADIFADMLLLNGVPRSSLIIENTSTNSGENIAFSKRLARELGKSYRSGVAVTTPLLSRRQKATLQQQWPEISWLMSTYMPTTVSARLAAEHPEEFLHLIVGEVDRLATYPDKGYTTPVTIPAKVLEARTRLADAGFDKYSIAPAA